MDTPATAVRRIIFGTGLGLLLVSGLLLIMDFLPPNNCISNDPDCIPTSPIGWFIPIFSFSFLIFSFIIYIKPNIFSKYLPDLNYTDRLNLLEDEILQEQLEDSNSNDAWTTLEKKLLSKKTEEE